MQSFGVCYKTINKAKAECREEMFQFQRDVSARWGRNAVLFDMFFYFNSNTGRVIFCSASFTVWCKDYQTAFVGRGTADLVLGEARCC